MAGSPCSVSPPPVCLGWEWLLVSCGCHHARHGHDPAAYRCVKPHVVMLSVPPMMWTWLPHDRGQACCPTHDTHKDGLHASCELARLLSKWPEVPVAYLTDFQDQLWVLCVDQGRIPNDRQLPALIHWPGPHGCSCAHGLALLPSCNQIRRALYEGYLLSSMGSSSSLHQPCWATGQLASRVHSRTF